MFYNKSLPKNLILNPEIKRIFILTGSGISQESGIETFRDKNGLWGKHSVYEVARPEAIELTPEIFFDFQNTRAKDYFHKKANTAHLKLKELEKKYQVTICTQNIDNLHEKAGSSEIFHVHGELFRAICHNCKKYCLYRENIFGSKCEKCDQGLIRPDTVLFKERPKKIKEIFEAMESSDLFIQIGTSGKVYPCANFVNEFKRLTGKTSINISIEYPENISGFDFSLLGKASEYVPLLVDHLLSI